MRTSHPAIPKRLPAGDGPKIDRPGQGLRACRASRKRTWPAFSLPISRVRPTWPGPSKRTAGSASSRSLRSISSPGRRSIISRGNSSPYLAKFHSSHVKERGVALGQNPGPVRNSPPDSPSLPENARPRGKTPGGRRSLRPVRISSGNSPSARRSFSGRSRRNVSPAIPGRSPRPRSATS